MDPTEAAIAGLGHVQQSHRELTELLQEWLEVERRRQQPAVPITIALSQFAPVKRDEASSTSMSIAVLNPSPVVVFLGLGGGRATADARAFSVPPGAGLCLPISAEDVEVGADPAALAGGDAVCYLLRFETVQPFYFWRA